MGRMTELCSTLVVTTWRFCVVSSALWMAAALLWILDAANNITMEPYRAYVSDRLQPQQHAQGFHILLHGRFVRRAPGHQHVVAVLEGQVLGGGQGHAGGQQTLDRGVVGLEIGRAHV